jgi:hypothetical protein
VSPKTTPRGPTIPHSTTSPPNWTPPQTPKNPTPNPRPLKPPAYEYAKILADLRRQGVKFRVLGLSATPGRDYDAVQARGGGAPRGVRARVAVAHVGRFLTHTHTHTHTHTQTCAHTYTTPHAPQEVITGLGASRVLYLDDGDPEVTPYTHTRDTELQARAPGRGRGRAEGGAREGARGAGIAGRPHDVELARWAQALKKRGLGGAP